jgi:transposase
MESEWAARRLESLGHAVIVADPNYAPMYATRARRVALSESHLVERSRQGGS